MKCNEKTVNAKEVLDRFSSEVQTIGSFLTSKTNVPYEVKYVPYDDKNSLYQQSLEYGSDKLFVQKHMVAINIDGDIIADLTIFYKTKEDTQRTFPTIKHWLLFERCNDIRKVMDFFEKDGLSKKEKLRILRSGYSIDIANLFYDEEQGTEIDFDKEYDDFVYRTLTAPSRRKELREKYQRQIISDEMPFAKYVHVCENFRKNDIAENMYLNMARELAKDKLCLYSAETQSDLGKEFWKRLASKHEKAITVYKIFDDGDIQYQIDGNKL